MAAEVRRVSELVNTLVGAVPGLVGGAVSGAASGLFVARAAFNYQQRAAAVSETRRLVLDADRSFHAWIMGTSYEGDSEADAYYQGFYEVAAKIDVLWSYYAIHAEWLTRAARASVEEIIREVGEHNARLFEARLNAGEAPAEREAISEEVRAANKWRSQKYTALLDNIRTRSSRQQPFAERLPWWRRWFGS